MSLENSRSRTAAGWNSRRKTGKTADARGKRGCEGWEIEEDKKIHAINSEDGYMILETKAIILAMGCRERTRGAIGIPGDRPKNSKS